MRPASSSGVAGADGVSDGQSGVPPPRQSAPAVLPRPPSPVADYTRWGEVKHSAIRMGGMIAVTVTNSAEPKTVGILIFPDVEILDFCGPFEVFASATLPAADRRRCRDATLRRRHHRRAARADRLPRRSAGAAQLHPGRSSSARHHRHPRRLRHAAGAGEPGRARLDRRAAPRLAPDDQRLHRGVPARRGEPPRR